MADPYRTQAEVPKADTPAGHQWEKVGESEVRTHDTATGVRAKKTQTLWVCQRCGSETIIDGQDHPDTKSVLYASEPLELDGTTILEPEIPSCDEAMKD